MISVRTTGKIGTIISNFYFIFLMRSSHDNMGLAGTGTSNAGTNYRRRARQIEIEIENVYNMYRLG
jgi:hypothetical protein